MPSVAISDPVIVAPRRAQGARRFYPQLDGFRALALLLVLAAHNKDLKLPGNLVYLFTAGWVGVDAFFVLSGFLITKILLDCEPSFRALGLFLLRRTLRTWPLYFLVLLAAWLTLRQTFTGAHINWLQHAFFLQNYAPQFVARSLNPTWSLCVEEHFYLLWPFLVFLLPRRALVWLVPVIFCVLPVGRYWGMHHGFTLKQLYSETQFHMDGLVAGSFIALVFSRWGAKKSALIWVGYAFVVMGAVTSFVGYRQSWDPAAGNDLIFGYSSVAIGFAGLLLLLLMKEGSMLAAAFSLRPLRYLGRISYGIYLLHDSVFSVLARIPLQRIVGSVAESWLFMISLRLGVSICVAALSYRFFESPILRLKDRLR